MTPYSLVEYKAKAIWISRWREGWFGVFTAYFDGSGHEEDPQMKFVSVAGFMAPAEVWIEFETKWRERLAQEGLSEFRMTECANYTKLFEGWQRKENERQQLLRDLVGIIKMVSRKFGCVIPLQAYRDKLPEDVRINSMFKAYVLGGRWCAGQVRQWTWQEMNVPHISNVQLFYERGDRWQESLKQHLVDDDLPEPIFKPKRDKYSDKIHELIERGLVQFQAADILAYLIFLKSKFEHRKGNDWGDKENIRWVLDRLTSDIMGRIDYVTPKNLEGLEILIRASSHDLMASSHMS